MSADTTQPATSPDQIRGMRSAILAQCCGTLGLTAFNNGIMLLYLTAQEMKSAHILVLLSLPLLASGLTQVPLAYFADRYGKKRFGFIGIVLNVLGYGLLIASSHFVHIQLACAAAGVILFGIGNGFFAAGWFALLSPVVPEHQRGRFFGRLRFSWQLVSIIFAAICTAFLSENTPVRTLQIILIVITFFIAARSYFYAGIPELEREYNAGTSLRTILGKLTSTTGYTSFACYIFLLQLFTGCCASVFGLVEEQAIMLEDRYIVILANITFVGSVVGYFLSGSIIDRFGTKRVFVGCHILFGLVFWLFLLRGFAPAGPLTLVYLALLHFSYGLAYASSSVATSTEMLALIPVENKSVSTSVIVALMFGGFALSGVLSGWALSVGMLAPVWTAFGHTMTDYDSILLVCGAMVVLLVVTLGLVPSVIAKAQPFPRGN